MGAAGPPGLAAEGPEPGAAPAGELPLLVPRPPATGAMVLAPLSAATPAPEEPPGRGCARPFCGTVDCAPCCCGCICCEATAPGKGAPFTAATMASCVRRLPPQALTAIAGRTIIVHPHR